VCAAVLLARSGTTAGVDASASPLADVVTGRAGVLSAARGAARHCNHQKSTYPADCRRRIWDDRLPNGAPHRHRIFYIGSLRFTQRSADQGVMRFASHYHSAPLATTAPTTQECRCYRGCPWGRRLGTTIRQSDLPSPVSLIRRLSALEGYLTNIDAAHNSCLRATNVDRCEDQSRIPAY
jgi:hypothetical protein